MSGIKNFIKIFNTHVYKLCVIYGLFILLGPVCILILNFRQNIEDFWHSINLLRMMYFIDDLCTNIKMSVSFNRHILYLWGWNESES
jgi:hypothetical protein